MQLKRNKVTWPKVVKIAIWLLKSYDFTSQYILNVLNHSKNSKMDEIGLKSSKIAKIGWNSVKSWFHHRFNAFSKEHNLSLLFPPAPGIQWLLAYCYYRTKAKSRNTFFLSSTFTHTQNKIKIPKFLNP
jgi:hypothetical protein